jgi:hypothetical protein
MRSIWPINFLALVLTAYLGPAHSQIQSIEDFAQHAETSAHELDYGIWDRFLKGNVFYNGFSDRRPGERAETVTGSRLARGHGGRYSDEGNRVMFSLMHPRIDEGLTAYREGLERVSNEIDFAQLSRKAQLAFWLNLHNVALIERLAHSYPRTQLESRYETLFETKDLTVAGVPLSLNDIRLRIVYKYWSDKPYVMYGFWTGSIGGPSIQKQAFTESNLNRVLGQAGLEFVNALRGVDLLDDGVLHVSKLYGEVRPFFFKDWPDDLIAHLSLFAQDAVKPMLAAAQEVRADVYEWDIADLVNGQPSGSMSELLITGSDGVTRIPGRLPVHARTFVQRSIERQRRMARSRQGTVTIVDVESDEED